MKYIDYSLKKLFIYYEIYRLQFKQTIHILRNSSRLKA